jgi:isoquinoline 1-oxidoreductase alpha subunit
VPDYSFTVNGRTVSVADVEPDIGLLHVLRDLLGITGPKYGCGLDVCKACTCHVKEDERWVATTTCNYSVADADGREFRTIEGLGEGGLHPVQQAWLDLDVAQCGFCQPGQIMTAAAMIDNGDPIDDEAIDGIENICRCGTYCRIRSAIKVAAGASGPIARRVT